MATDLFKSVFSIFVGTVPDLTADLYDEPFRIRVTSSWELTSEIDSRCRGAKGEVAGAVDDEYKRAACFHICWQCFGGRKKRVVAIVGKVILANRPDHHVN